MHKIMNEMTTEVLDFGGHFILRFYIKYYFKAGIATVQGTALVTIVISSMRRLQLPSFSITKST